MRAAMSIATLLNAILDELTHGSLPARNGSTLRPSWDAKQRLPPPLRCYSC